MSQPTQLASRDLSQKLAESYKAACLAELSALKPGNVHIFADGHGMQVADFIRSAEASAPHIAAASVSVGQRILTAMQATWNAVGCNTNLGIILLCAPLIQAMLNRSQTQSTLSLRHFLQQVLCQLSIADAEWVYQAIRLAAPAGLGSSEQQDVRSAPTITLLTAMRIAQDKDQIANQYVNGFAAIFDVGITAYQQAMQRWDNEAWAITAVYLTFLAGMRDSHVARKYNDALASSLQQQALPYLQLLLSMDNPKTCQHELLCWDTQLKADGINPGTSADLTVATIFAVMLENGG